MKYLSFVLSLLLFPMVGFSQDKALTDTFLVVKAFEPTLIDAKKISFEPSIDDTIKIEHDLSYRFVPTHVEVDAELEPIDAARIKSEPLIKLYRGYAKLGLGTNFTPWTELYYHNLRSDEYSIGTHLKYTHFNGINDIEHSDRSDGQFSIYGKRFWKTNTLEADLGYDFSGFSFYGIPDEIQEGLIESQDLEQTYNILNANFALGSTIRDSFNLRHDFELGFHQLSSEFATSELGFQLNGKLSKIENREFYNLDVGLDLNSAENLYDSSSNVIVSLVPSIQTSGKILNVRAGLSINAQMENSTKFTFYPDVELSANLIENILVPYAGINGGVRRNSFRSIIDQNRYISDSIPLMNSNVKYNAYFGIRGTISSKIAFNANFTKRKVDNFMMFVRDTTAVLRNKFTTIYDDVEELGVKAELSYNLNEKLKIYLVGEYFGYNPGGEIEVWHKPLQKATLTAIYNLRNKILARVDVIYIGDQLAKGYDENGLVQKINLGGIVDANLSLEYRYTKRVSAFVEFNNILGSSYEKWQDYRLQKFNFMGGFTYGF